MTTIRGLVLKILKEHPEARNSDKLLYAQVIEAMGLTFSIENLERLPSPESIRRRRQEAQAEGKFIPTDPEVLAIRKFYNLCPREILSEEGQPVEIVLAVCRRCPRDGLEDCNLIGEVPAGVGLC